MKELKITELDIEKLKLKLYKSIIKTELNIELEDIDKLFDSLYKDKEVTLSKTIKELKK
jgi:hypothetical protein